MVEELTPVEQSGRSMAAWTLIVIILVLYVGGLALYRRFLPDMPTVHRDIQEHFKYDSIGSEAAGAVSVFDDQRTAPDAKVRAVESSNW